MTDPWEQILQKYRTTHIHVLTREDLAHTALEHLIADTSASWPTQIFLRQLADSHVSLWDAFVRSVQCVHEDLQESDLFSPLKSLIEHATHLAVVYGEENFWKSPDKWSYLVEVTGLWEHRLRRHFLFHPPATMEHIRQAETIIGVPLPPTFVRFLTCTNGLGLDYQELAYICGAGETRAFWSRLTEWDRPSYHEIASEWWQWQDLYAYERQRDQERGISADRSDEQVSIPFAQLSDAWCFDCSKPGEFGEYLVLYWDHEQRLREEGAECPSFETWFEAEVIRGEYFVDDEDELEEER